MDTPPSCTIAPEGWRWVDDERWRESPGSSWIPARPRVMICSMPSKRSYGTGELYEKHGAYYGRWRTSDDRKLNRKVGSVRNPGSADGLTRA